MDWGFYGRQTELAKLRAILKRGRSAISKRGVPDELHPRFLH